MRYIATSFILSAAAIIRLSTSLPLEVRQQNFRRAAYNIVNVDGSASSSTIETLAETVTKTTSEVSTATVTSTASPSGSVIVATIDVVESSTTSTIVVTATPEVFDPAVTATSSPTTTSSSSGLDPPAVTSLTTAPAEIPPLMPFGGADPPITSTILVSSATVSSTDPTSTDECEDDDMWDEGKPTTISSHSWSHPTTYPTAYGSGTIPSDMPALPKETPTWYNRTEIPPYREMKPRAALE